MRRAWRVLIVQLLVLQMGGALAAACDHPFGPVRAGWVWTYRQGDTQFEVRREPAGPGEFTETTASPSAPGTRRYACEQGAHLPLQAEVRVPGVDVRVLTARGVSLLPAAQWQVGAAWRYSMDLNATLQGPLGLSGPGRLDVTFRVVGRETVSVPAGQFDAFTVEVTREMRGQLGLFPFQRTVRHTMSYAPGIGLVREEAGPGRVELVSLRRP